MEPTILASSTDVKHFGEANLSNRAQRRKSWPLAPEIGVMLCCYITAPRYGSTWTIRDLYHQDSNDNVRIWRGRLVRGEARDRLGNGQWLQSIRFWHVEQWCKADSN